MGDSLAGAMGNAGPDDLVGVVLAAGEGRRLRPLTLLRPKPLCPVGGVALVDGAVERVTATGLPLAANVHHGREQLEAHLAEQHPNTYVSIEERQALGTAGALGRLRPWIAGRGVLVVNGDTWSDADLAAFVAEWDGERISVLVAGSGGFERRSRIAASIVPWPAVAALEAEPTGLFELCWAPAAAAGTLHVANHRGALVDCGTPSDYLRANLMAVERAGATIVAADAEVTGAAERSVVGAGASVAGVVRSSVLWEGTEVAAGEELDHVIKASARMTVLVR
jgi:N-acetyl-alpha-D-muramate 1-phosphate uridylyltransferase